MALHALGAALMSGSVAGAGAVAQAATDGAPAESLWWAGGGVGVALVVGWMLIQRSDRREQSALDRADGLIAKRDATIDKLQRALVDEQARRLAAESLLERRERDHESRRSPDPKGT